MMVWMLGESTREREDEVIKNLILCNGDVFL